MLHRDPSEAANKPAIETINQRLTLYSFAAAAAGVGVLALAQPAEGSIVVTQADVTVGVGTPAFIDLNGDGKTDFEFSIARGGYDHSFYNTLNVIPLTGGRPVGGARGQIGPYGSALVAGAKIGPSAHFSSSVARGQVMLERTNGFVSGSSQYTAYGPWGVKGTYGSYRYLGVKFLINGQTHYGWIKLLVSRSPGFQGFIQEFAYETTANKSLTAGQTQASTLDSSTAVEQNKLGPVGPSLGMLAAGVDGLPLWREQETHENSQPSTALLAGE
jgi:hypothetical protein